MPDNGLKITVSKEDFMSKPIAEQNWILLNAQIQINKYGCEFARKYCKEETWKKISVLGAAIGGGLTFGGGIAYGVFKLIGAI